MGVSFVVNRSVFEILISELGVEIIHLKAGMDRALRVEDYAAAGLYKAKLTQVTSDLNKIEAAHVISTWDGSWDQAFEWAVEIGAQPNIFAARNSLKNLVEAQFGGNRETARTLDVKYAFYHKQKAKAGTHQPVEV